MQAEFVRQLILIAVIESADDDDRTDVPYVEAAKRIRNAVFAKLVANDALKVDPDALD